MVQKEYVPVVLWFLWIFSGTLWYSLYEGHPWAVALYQSTSVGWALGWSLPTDTQRTDDSISLCVSTLHNSIGVMFTGLAVTYMADRMTQSKENWMLRYSRRRNLKRDIGQISGSAVSIWFRRGIKWMRLYRDETKVVIIACLCFLFGVFFGSLFLDFSGGMSMDMTLSTLTTSGYRGLPESASHWQYIVISIYTNLAVPIFTISLSILVSFFMEKPEEKDFYTKVAAPITETELEFMTKFGIISGTGFINLKEYIILTILRIGSIQPDVIIEIKERFDSMLECHDVEGIGMIPYNKIFRDDVPSDDRVSIFSNFIPRRLQKVLPFTHSIASDDQNHNHDDHNDQQPTDDSCQLPRRKGIRRTILRALGRTESTSVMNVDTDSSRELPSSYNHNFSQNKSAMGISPEIKSRMSNRRNKTTYQRDTESIRYSIRLGDHKPRQLSPKSGKAAAHITDTPTREQKLLFINRKFQSSKVLPIDHDTNSTTKVSNNRSFLGEGFNKAVDENQAIDDFEKGKIQVLSIDEQCREDEHDTILSQRQIWEESMNDTILYAREEKVDNRKHDVDTVVECIGAKRENDYEVKNDENDRSDESEEELDQVMPLQPDSLSQSQKSWSEKKTVPDRPKLGGLSYVGSTFSTSLREITGIGKKKKKRTLRFSTLQRLEKISQAHKNMMKKKSSFEMLKKNFMEGLVSFVIHSVKEDYKVQALLLWITWLNIGALFYALKMDITFQRGFYISVNVGYAVYWDTFDNDAIEKSMSVCHLIVGQAFFSFALAALARSLIVGSKVNWYLEALQLRELKVKRSTQSSLKNICDNLLFYIVKLKAIIWFLMFLSFGITFSCLSMRWSFEDGLYFAVTCMSTGGIWSLPNSASDNELFITAIFTGIGAPIMLYTFGTLAQVVNSHSKSSTLQQELHKPMTYLELEFMQFEVIEDGSGYINASEFTLLMLVRMKALKPELISTIIHRFTILDVNDVGEISYEDVTTNVDNGENGGGGDDNIDDDQDSIRMF